LLSRVRISVLNGLVMLTERVVRGKVKYLIIILREVDKEEDQKADGRTVYRYW
jgi:hypothetical protein